MCFGSHPNSIQPWAMKMRISLKPRLHLIRLSTDQTLQNYLLSRSIQAAEHQEHINGKELFPNPNADQEVAS